MYTIIMLRNVNAEFIYRSCEYLNSLIFPWNFVKIIKFPDFSQIYQIPKFVPDWKTRSHFSSFSLISSEDGSPGFKVLH